MTTGSNLRRLDSTRRHDGPMTYRLDGDVFEMPDPAEMTFEEVLTCLHTGLLAPDCVGLNLWQAEALTRRWIAHYDLPSYADAQRLAYVVDRYTDDLIYDLRVHARVDLVEMWQERRWRTLLATIDRIPSYSLYSEAVSMDEEHAEMLAASLAARESSGNEKSAAGPALRTWTPELKAMTDLTDAVRRVEWAVIAAAAGKNAPNPPEPLPRPTSVMAKALKAAETKRRLATHEKLAQRLLPHKRPDYVNPELPPGWKYDASGRLRNELGRYAKKPE